MISLDGDVLRVTGPMRLPEATGLRDAALDLLKSARSIDLSGVTEVDSSAIAVLLAWERNGGNGKALPVTGAPEGLTSLARLYEVSSFCGLEAVAS